NVHLGLCGIKSPWPLSPNIRTCSARVATREWLSHSITEWIQRNAEPCVKMIARTARRFRAVLGWKVSWENHFGIHPGPDLLAPCRYPRLRTCRNRTRAGWFGLGRFRSGVAARPTERTRTHRLGLHRGCRPSADGLGNPMATYRGTRRLNAHGAL